ncbi:MAG: alpha/beta fold hydrolase [Limnospira sp. PMC 1291.21]|uniref:alpha/beta hydrolase n=1 Tax=unclassified Limnospira TaxID=2642885 RepID=UPI0028E0D4C8|nr:MULTISPECIES: alpha/beta fold hydrolase [unclassified Limnospira]MDT9177033.1 alpha/beta fold hydrolase [Limnospira sp. PMC 1238.20]MDT9191770.1 alpha/beta fold hydrolase [Limnospira sp. PMC 1245.20]MDT9204635.1 alpha/beta fold hydrolase [Limnospira sp. PMC 1243.20]MDT9207777.1 alpha/beta fold hydrolase [Limnospira sp. PMC 1252.20]MDT9212976.1 alpha/beta fold hydrolase [Limnospira sp. PMC 1256.20]
MSEHLRYFSGFESLAVEWTDKIWSRGVPFWLRAEPKSNRVVLCLHGFTATPFEVRPVAQACLSRGLDGVGPLLPGHGFQELADQKLFFPKMTAEGMLSAVRRELELARSHYEFVGIFGHSMGGAIALKMAAEGRVDACAVTAPALKLPPRAVILLALFGWANISIPTQPKPFDNPVYLFDNSRAGRALQQLARIARSDLSSITCPVLAIHSHRDDLVSPVVINWMEKQLPNNLDVRWFDQSGHVMILDVNGEEISQAIADFFSHRSI